MVGDFKLFLYGICQLSLVIFGSYGLNTGDSCTDALGNEGVCTNIFYCHVVMEGIKNKILPITCSFNGRIPIVCCPKTVYTLSSPPAATTSVMKPGNKAEYWCGVYRTYCPTSLVGADLANIKEFPHMAAIGYGAKENILWSCGGMLVSEKFVLTAAHCLSSGEGGPVKWVLLATEVIRRTTEQASPNARRGQTHPVVRKIRHPGYKPPSKYNDIALLEIGPALETNALKFDTEELHPACLPIKLSENPRKIIATGWGRIGFGERTSPDLLKVELNILDSAICNETYKVEITTTTKLSRGIDNTMICAGVLEGGKDTCQGDSGGPLQVPIKETCLYEIWGITSFGKICGFANSPAIYTRVPEYVPWIESIVWP